MKGKGFDLETAVGSMNDKISFILSSMISSEKIEVSEEQLKDIKKENEAYDGSIAVEQEILAHNTQELEDDLDYLIIESLCQKVRSRALIDIGEFDFSELSQEDIEDIEEFSIIDDEDIALLQKHKKTVISLLKKRGDDREEILSKVEEILNA